LQFPPKDYSHQGFSWALEPFVNFLASNLPWSCLEITTAKARISIISPTQRRPSPVEPKETKKGGEGKGGYAGELRSVLSLSCNIFGHATCFHSKLTIGILKRIAMIRINKLSDFDDENLKFWHFEQLISPNFDNFKKNLINVDPFPFMHYNKIPLLKEEQQPTLL